MVWIHLKKKKLLLCLRRYIFLEFIYKMKPLRCLRRNIYVDFINNTTLKIKQNRSIMTSRSHSRSERVMGYEIIYSLKLKKQSLDSLLLQTRIEQVKLLLTYLFLQKAQRTAVENIASFLRYTVSLVIPLCFPQKEFEKEMRNDNS